MFADIAILMFSFLCTVSLIANHGVGSSLQPGGIGIVETVGPYFLARCYIRGADDFRNMFRLLFRTVLVLLPFALIEFFTGHNLWRDMFAAVWPVEASGQMASRSGLTRVQMGFDHPILFGVCICSIVAPAYLVVGYGEPVLRRLFRGRARRASDYYIPFRWSSHRTFLSGTTPFVERFATRDQESLEILLALSVSLGFAAQLIAKRSLLTILASFFVFDSASYWYRLFIWQYGTESVTKHPMLGIGLNDWERPSWMVNPSMDDFWLLLAVRFGLPASVFLLLTMLSILVGLLRKKGFGDKLSAYRTAFLISLVTFFLAGWTVHYWDASYVFLMFFMGSGIWMLDAHETSMSGPLRSPRAGSESTIIPGPIRGFRPFARDEAREMAQERASRPLDGMDALIAMTAEATITRREFATSIVIPAHNEAAVIGRLLSALPGSVEGGRVQVIVACNGCTDDTAEIARRHGATVVEIETPSKIAALNAADDVAVAFPRLYVDADVLLSPKTVNDLIRALGDSETLCAAPPSKLQLAGRPLSVRAYFAVWKAVMLARDGYAGAGVYAVSRQGRARFGRFPNVIADDLFVRNSYTRAERRIVATDPTIVEAPRTLRALLRRRVRVCLGNSQLFGHPDYKSLPGNRELPLPWWRVVLANPQLIPASIVYAAVNGVARVMAYRLRGKTVAAGVGARTTPRESAPPTRTDASRCYRQGRPVGGFGVS